MNNGHKILANQIIDTHLVSPTQIVSTKPLNFSSTLSSQMKMLPSVVLALIVSSCLGMPLSTTTNPDDFGFETGMFYMNRLRENHQVPPLQANDTLTISAQNYADQCKLVYSGYDETVYGFFGGDAPSLSDAIEDWYKAEVNYDYTNPEKYQSDVKAYFNVSQFVRLVYASARSVGCARSYCRDTMHGTGYIVVCRFDSAVSRSALKENVNSGGWIPLKPDPSSPSQAAPPSATEPPYVTRHNEYRAQHGIGRLQYDEALEAIAQNRANQSDCELRIPTNFFGPIQNVYKGSAITSANILVEATDAFYAGAIDDNSVGNLMQVLNTHATRVGCASSLCSMKNVIAFCVYDY